VGTSDGYVERLVLVAGDGQIASRFNIVLVADGYRDVDRTLFEADAAQIAISVLSAKPFVDHADTVNIFRLDVWSAERGAGDASHTVRTYFDSAFDANVPQLLLANTALVANTVQLAFSSDGSDGHAHKMIVVVNTDTYGGSGGVGAGVAVASRAEAAITLLHELGHLFGLLDEYDRPNVLASFAESVAPNLASSSVRTDLPWADLVAPKTFLPTDGHRVPDATVGAFSVDDDGTSYRPQWRCRMRHTVTGSYCAVCERHIARILEKV